MRHFFGIIEDRRDPLKIGRVRVRVRGVHTHEKRFVATPDLPWAHVIMPVTTPGLGGLGKNHNLVEGTSVIGVFTDKAMQQFLVLGVNQGVSQKVFIENEKDIGTDISPDYGFNDPRRVKSDDYESVQGKPDAKNPDHFKSRTHGLDKGLDFYPHLPKGHIFDYTGRGLTQIDEYKDSEKTLPYYPIVKDASDINVFSTQDGKDAHTSAPLSRDLSLIGGGFSEVKSSAKPQYPFNHATYTESGHLFELDDTRSHERVSLQHRSGTYFEWQPDGDAHTRIVKDNYTAILNDDEIFIGGKVNIKVLGDATLNIGGDLKADVAGKTDITGSENITVTAPIIDLNGKTIKLNS